MRKRKRIGYGPLDLPDQSNSKVWLKNEFLKTIEKLEPEKERKPLGDLAKQPLEQYINFVEKQDGESISRRQKLSARWNEPDRQPGLSFFSLLDETDPLRVSIQEWGKTYHLNSAWCFDVALLTLQTWHQFNKGIGKQFETLPHYGHPDYLGFGSLVSAYNLIITPRGSLDEPNKAFVDSLSERDKKRIKSFVEFFNERERAFLSSYPLNPYMDDDFALDQIKHVVEGALSLPVLNLLSADDLDTLRDKLRQEGKRLWERVNVRAKQTGSVRPLEVGTNKSEHIEWAVRYQVFEEDYYLIGEKEPGYQSNKHSTAVSIGERARRILKSVDLKPRTPQKGRQRDL